MVAQSLSSRMEAVEKYRDLACILRERADLPALQYQRDQILALADHFDRLADEVSKWCQGDAARDSDAGFARLRELCRGGLCRYVEPSWQRLTRVVS